MHILGWLSIFSWGEDNNDEDYYYCYRGGKQLPITRSTFALKDSLDPMHGAGNIKAE